MEIVRAVFGIVRVMLPLSRVDILGAVTSFSSEDYIGLGLLDVPSTRESVTRSPGVVRTLGTVDSVTFTVAHQTIRLLSGKEATSIQLEVEAGTAD